MSTLQNGPRAATASDRLNADQPVGYGGAWLDAPLLTVTNRVSPEDRSQDELYEFSVDGQRRTFGRDDLACDIVIWTAHNGRDLGRVAGEIWRWGDELWLRNLSTTHELQLSVPGLPPDPPLRRRRDPNARGAACSIPAPSALITAPGGCLLEITQQHQPPAAAFTYGLSDPTMTVVPEVPDRFKPLAVALCEPLLHGGRLPAAYGELMTRLGATSLKSLRRQVDELCALYTDASPQLAQRVTLRRQRQNAVLDPVQEPVKDGSIYRFAPSTSEVEVPARPRGLSLPDYYEVALLLVRHYRITIDDLILLPSTTKPGEGSQQDRSDGSVNASD
jgi:hypothetical protein